MNKILIDDLISIIYAHHKESNHYSVEPNHEAKYMSRLKNKSFDKKVKWVKDMLSKAPKCFPLDMEYADELNYWVTMSDTESGSDSSSCIESWQYAGYLWQYAIDGK